MKKMTTTRFIAYWLCLCPLFCMGQDRESDSLALVALYNATDGVHWTNTWNLTQPMDDWYGVTLDENGRVTCIDMDGGDNDCYADYFGAGNNLSGNIPPEIGNLGSLKELNLMNNKLTGSIPSEIGGLEQLIYLFLYVNQLSGNIPEEIGNLSSLLVLQWEHNQLSGSIPSTIGNLDSLIYLSLGSNQLSGNIPPEIGNLSKLSELRLWGNQLTGDIPPEIGNLSNLQLLMLSANQLSGSIPPEIQNLNSLTYLSLGSNELTGSIPSEIVDLTALTYLNLSNNQLYGCYDDSLLNLCNQLSESSNMDAHISDGNEFVMTWEDFCSTGESCTPCRQSDSLALVAFYEATNGANWINTWNLDLPMDTWYGISLNLSGCVTCIDMDGGSNDCYGDYFDDGNNLSGNIPSAIGNLKSLKDLNLMNNQLTGSIPSEIGGGEQLISLLMGGNQLSGNIPEEIGNLANLRVMNLAANELSGNIPPTIGNLDNLSSLQLWSNQLTGDIPSQIWYLSNLSFLMLSDNQLTGSIPSEIENLTNIQTLRIGSNQLTGSIPSEITNLEHLTSLNLSHNQLNGNIPNLSDSTDLQTLLLDNNKFSFDAIEAIYSSISSNVDFQYSPQYHGEVQSHIVTLDTTLTLELSTPLPGNNNQNVSYQWKRNYNNLEGSTDATYTIDSLQLSNVGKYTLYMTDTSRVPDLEVISEPIYVTVPRYDLYGQPVVYNQIIIEFGNEAEKLEYEGKYVHIERADLAGQVKDSCACNRLLYLWEFPTDSIALQVLLDVNTKLETVDDKQADIDGGPNNILNIGPIVSGEGWTWTGDYSNYPDSVLVYLLDSGVDTTNWDASPYLFDNAPIDTCHDTIFSSGFDYTDTLTTISGDFIDSLGHGTYGFRSIAEGLDDYMNLKIVPLKTFNEEGESTLFDFVCALYHAIDHNADIIHVSAGYKGQPSDILEKAIDFAKEKDCLIVTAAGNDGINIDSIPQYPAYYAKEFYKEGYNGNDSLVHYDHVISVTSINVQNELSTFSNYGVGSVVLSTYGEDMSGYSHTGADVSSSGSSVSAYYVTRELATEIAKDRNRTYQQIWEDFKFSRLKDCPSTIGFTRTGKRLDINLNEVYGELRVYLEGPYHTDEGKMHTELNNRYLLPGQSHEDSTLNHNLAIQPYNNIMPYNYQGNEAVPDGLHNYPSRVVDWILVSLRTDIASDTEVSRTAAWLLDNGDIQLLKPFFDDVQTAPDSAFILIEHRNHMGVMSSEKVPIRNNIVVWDFTEEDGYTTPTSTGQVELPSGAWAMYAGDGKQDNDIGGYDINGDDKIIWQDDNGKFLLYLQGDYNMNGDANGDDKGYWEKNNGKSSNIPR